jgi:hypothetical protein
MSENLDALRNHLATLPQGPVENPAEIEKLLAPCWDELAGGQGGMAGYKLHGRTENMEWNAPLLRFEIERHGARAMGSVYAEIQVWKIDVENGTAQPGLFPQKKLVGERQARWDAEPVADEIAELIRNGKEDPRFDQPGSLVQKK